MNLNNYLKMQWNQPFENFAFNSSFYNAVPYYPRAIGEGEILSIVFPDGSMQLYFVPTFKHGSPNQRYTNVVNNQPTNTEYWFIRSVIPPNSFFDARSPIVHEDRYKKQFINPNYDNICSPDYYQKFHNDNSTSTTDFLYFYPNFRLNNTLKNSALVQTSTPIENQNCLNNGNCERCCNCKVTFSIEDKDNCACKESDSCMSVDSIQNISKQKIKKRKKQRNTKHKDHICGCNNKRSKNKFDKIVTTYTDRASGNVPLNGRETQTTQKHKSKRSDIKTEVWVPLKEKRRGKSNSSRAVKECSSCCYSDKCMCCSTTDTEGQ